MLIFFTTLYYRPDRMPWIALIFWIILCFCSFLFNHPFVICTTAADLVHLLFEQEVPFHFTIRISVQRDRSMPTAEACLDALWNLVTQFLYMMAPINRDGDAVEHQAFAEGVDPSAEVEREVEINVRDIV